MVRLHAPIRRKQAAVYRPNAFTLGDNRARHQTDKNFLDLHYRSGHHKLNRHHNLSAEDPAEACLGDYSVASGTVTAK
jgi:hypothetical protein